MLKKFVCAAADMFGLQIYLLIYGWLVIDATSTAQWGLAQ
jgi:hypothetical protein